VALQILFLLPGVFFPRQEVISFTKSFSLFRLSHTFLFPRQELISFTKSFSLFRLSHTSLKLRNFSLLNVHVYAFTQSHFPSFLFSFLQALLVRIEHLKIGMGLDVGLDVGVDEHIPQVFGHITLANLLTPVTPHHLSFLFLCLFLLNCKQVLVVGLPALM